MEIVFTVLVILLVPTSGVSYVRNVGQDAIFMLNRTSGSIFEAQWGLFDNGFIRPSFIYINKFANRPIHSSDLDTPSASRYKGRVFWVGDLNAGRAWYKITNLNINDTNEYAVRLQDGNAVDTICRMNLIVAVSPQFNPQPPRTKTIAEGQDLSLPCTAIGPPTPNITWVQIAGHLTKSTGIGTATLRIPNISRNHKGRYECQARNNPNEKPANTRTVVTVYYPPKSTVTPPSITAVQGAEIVLSCTADGYPTPSISWTKADGVIKAGNTVAGGTLTIPDAIKTDAGKYICTAKNSYDSREHVNTTTATVLVKHQPSIMLGILKNQTLNESDSLSIKCDADGYPPPTIQWKTPTGSVHTGNVYNIPSVSRSHAGTYTCTASNGIGKEAMASIQVIVQYPPDIDVAKSNRTSKSWKGKSIRLRCFATGSPAPRISWYKPTNQQIIIGVNIVPGGSEVTVLTTTDQGDYGQYKCRATNILGSDEHVINVTQLFPPGVVTITTTEVEASSITVGWTKPADSGGLPVSIYLLEVSTKPPVSTVNTHAVITGLKANTQYTVKVYAKNDAGYGNASVKFITTKKQGKPTVPQLTLALDLTNGLLVKLSWTKPDDNGGEITNYTIYMKENGPAELKEIHEILDPKVLEYEVKKNLEYGKAYKFLVTAWNKYGESAKQEELAKTIKIPKEKTKTDPNKGKRTTNVDGESNAAVIPGVVGAVLFMLLVGIILGVIIIRKKGLLSKGFGRKSPSNRAAYDNDVDPDSANQQAAAAGLGGEDDGAPTYAAVDMSKKKKKNDIPDYTVVDKSKKKRPGEIIYAELADFNTAGSSAAATAPRPIAYTSTDYADITQFQKQEEPEPTYANFPGRGKKYTDIQGM